MTLPPGHALRPARREDAPAAFALTAACERADTGVVDSTLRDVEHEWFAAGFDLARDACLVEDPDGRIVGAAWLHRGHTAAAVFVSPDLLGRGIGTALLQAIEARALEVYGAGAKLNQVARGSNDAARALLAAAGYESHHRYTRMRIELDGPTPEPSLPEGVELRPMRRGIDDRAVWEIDVAAFSSSPDYTPSPFERFDDHLGWPGVAFDASPVAWEGEKPVGFALNELREGGTGFVAILGVHPDHQGRGLGRALLLRSFADLAARGARTVELGVLGGNERAWRLYESAGMSAAHTADRYEKTLAPQ